MTDKRNSSLRKLTGSWLKRAAMAGLRFAFLLLSGLWSATWYLLVFAGLLLWLSLDLLPSRKSKPLTSPTPNRRKLPVPIREGSDIFVIMPDGTKVDIEPLQAKLYAEEWYQVIAGAFVYERTRIKLDDSK